MFFVCFSIGPLSLFSPPPFFFPFFFCISLRGEQLQKATNVSSMHRNNGVSSGCIVCLATSFSNGNGRLCAYWHDANKIWYLFHGVTGVNIDSISDGTPVPREDGISRDRGLWTGGSTQGFRAVRVLGAVYFQKQHAHVDLGSLFWYITLGMAFGTALFSRH